MEGWLQYQLIVKNMIIQVIQIITGVVTATVEMRLLSKAQYCEEAIQNHVVAYKLKNPLEELKTD